MHRAKRPRSLERPVRFDRKHEAQSVKERIAVLAAQTGLVPQSKLSLAARHSCPAALAGTEHAAAVFFDFGAGGLDVDLEDPVFFSLRDTAAMTVRNLDSFIMRALVAATAKSRLRKIHDVDGVLLALGDSLCVPDPDEITLQQTTAGLAVEYGYAGPVVFIDDTLTADEVCAEIVRNAPPKKQRAPEPTSAEQIALWRRALGTPKRPRTCM